jgi:hypothetical protein
MGLAPLLAEDLVANIHEVHRPQGWPFSPGAEREDGVPDRQLRVGDRATDDSNSTKNKFNLKGDQEKIASGNSLDSQAQFEDLRLKFCIQEENAKNTLQDKNRYTTGWQTGRFQVALYSKNGKGIGGFQK